MDKLLIVILILLLFFIPILAKENVDSKINANQDQSDSKEKLCKTNIQIVNEKEPIPLEEYVVGVVAGEMPITFHSEALKAQATAARTYSLRATNYGQNPIAADVSAQVYMDLEQRKVRWGKDFKKNERKIRKIVQATAGDVLVYGDEMISAMFFSTSNGMTETALNFSGNEVPYLQSVDSKEELAISPKVKKTTEFSLQQWNTIFGGQWHEDDFRALQLVRNTTGRVQKVIAGSFTKSGREMRELLELPSTDFNIAFDITNKVIIVETTGYGHGVGMSQYGAQAFAEKGWNAKKILMHYYKDTKIKKFTIDNSRCLKTP